MSAELRVDLEGLDYRDARRMAELDRSGFDDPWPESIYRLMWTVRGVKSLGAIHDGLIVGMAVWHARKSSLMLLRLAVSPAYRRKGIGTLLVKQVAGLMGGRRSALIAAVDERNLGGQMFAKSCGLIAYGNAYDGKGSLLYLFRLRLEDRCGSVVVTEG